MKMRYDPKVEAMYIEMAKGTYKVSRKISDSVLIDEDSKGKILGIEILDVPKTLVSKLMKKQEKSSLTRAVAHKIR